MKLPVKQILSKNKKHYQIVDNTKKVIIPDIPEIGDAMQIEEALNNYPKAIELLKSLGATKDSPIGEFLKSIE